MKKYPEQDYGTNVSFYNDDFWDLDIDIGQRPKNPYMEHNSHPEDYIYVFGGVRDYLQLDNIPKINGVPIIGNLGFQDDLGWTPIPTERIKQYAHDYFVRMIWD